MPSKKRSAKTPSIPEREATRLVAAAITEDLGKGDLTSSLSIPRELQAQARIFARESGVLAGGPIAAKAFRQVDPKIRVRLLRREGSRLRRGDCVLFAQGSARSLLAAERTALNFLQHLSGVATQTARIVRATKGCGVRVLATRKTIPGLRALQKYAVEVGGGSPHRQGLFDAILIKENHLDMAGRRPEQLLRSIRARAGRKASIGAEARNLGEALRLLEGGADWILLDNMSPTNIRNASRALRARARTLGRKLELEASGGIHEGNALAYARAGVDRISLGGLTHSVRAMDFSMDFLPIHKQERRKRGQQ